MPVNNLVNI